MFPAGTHRENPELRGFDMTQAQFARCIGVESGLCSFDRTMPEEINRIVTDQLSDVLFTPSEDADINLQREGIRKERILRVGNVIIDSLIRLLPAAMQYTKNGLPASAFQCR